MISSIKLNHRISLKLLAVKMRMSRVLEKALFSIPFQIWARTRRPDEDTSGDKCENDMNHSLNF